jgi:hypothetical protein
MPDVTWKITPKGKRFTRQRLVFLDIADHASGYSEMRLIAA